MTVCYYRISVYSSYISMVIYSKMSLYLLICLEGLCLIYSCSLIVVSQLVNLQSVIITSFSEE